MSFQTTYLRDFPEHIAIIMDGNGRWAKARHRPRVFGHQKGVETVRHVVEQAAEIGVRCLTLYSFSTENWSRPKAEIAALFNLLKKYVESDLESLHARDVRVRILGSRVGLKPDLLELIERVETTTQGNTKFSLNIAFNYGGRDEILRAAAKAAKAGEDFATMSDADFGRYLDTADLPEVDLVVRTSGECRISNFLLWQAAYAEFYFTDVLWPDFTIDDLSAAIEEFRARDRRFGNLSTPEVA
ncbi:polyprenyl diphosphate synthase [Litorimonas sp. RW-G-Af-16]|uniref:polyprenyl diphosphate synthase n=1 Tax=Litorimonas sp. RW-G-Af-16 TaxID=3241168 RepID=UPI00390C977C